MNADVITIIFYTLSGIMWSVFLYQYLYFLAEYERKHRRKMLKLETMIYNNLKEANKLAAEVQHLKKFIVDNERIFQDAYESAKEIGKKVVEWKE